MDAGGRIFPCCCSPRPNADLNFAQFDAGASADSFNSDKHRRSRLFFENPEDYRADRKTQGFDQDPYCVKCEWDKTADPSPAQIRNYFQAAGHNLFDLPSLEGVEEVVISKEVVEGSARPLYIYADRVGESSGGVSA